jgi:hypothetical protein
VKRLAKVSAFRMPLKIEQPDHVAGSDFIF